MNTNKKFRTLLINLSVLVASVLLLLVVSPASAAAGPLSADEIAGLQFMREEEKLARDVYLTLYQKWGLAIFNNIANGEATHMAAVKTLLDRYGITDPAAGKAVGIFADPTLQALYNQIGAQGSQSHQKMGIVSSHQKMGIIPSLSAALKVGGAIEEIDMRDLKERIARTTHADIKTVYNNLLNGSYNHLRSFVSALKTRTGEVYQPQDLDAATYQSMISGSHGWRGGWR